MTSYCPWKSLILVLLVTASASAVTTTWTGSVNTDCYLVYNWTSTVPAAGDTANINAVLSPAVYPVVTGVMPATGSITSVNLNSGAQLTIDPNGTLNTTCVKINSAGSVGATLIVNAGGVLSAINGSSLTWAAGTADIRGAVSINKNLTLASGGPAPRMMTVNVLDGGILTVGGSGILTVGNGTKLTGIINVWGKDSNGAGSLLSNGTGVPRIAFNGGASYISLKGGGRIEFPSSQNATWNAAVEANTIRSGSPEETIVTIPIAGDRTRITTRVTKAHDPSPAGAGADPAAMTIVPLGDVPVSWSAPLASDSNDNIVCNLYANFATGSYPADANGFPMDSSGDDLPLYATITRPAATSLTITSAAGGMYQWRVDCTENRPGDANYPRTEKGEVWYFRTGVGLPGIARNPMPANGASEQSVNVEVSWSSGALAASYDVYFGTNPTPGSGEYRGERSAMTYSPGTLASGTTYYWRIDSRNGYGTTTGQVWSFATMFPPSAPTGVSATDGSFADRVALTWNIVTGADGYEIWRSGVNDIATALKIATNMGGTNTTYDDTSAGPGAVCWYWIRAFNVAGTGGAGSSDSGYRGISPAITSEPSPASQTICPGQSAEYCVSASGTAPLSYQWQKDGSDIPGATSDCYIASAAGIYRCVVSNACGSVTSDNAVLTVNTPPAITSEPSPASQTICPGQSAQYCVSASGTAPLSYQWQKDGSDIPGATSDCYIASAAGIYRCVVSNACGSVTSDNAVLTVNTPPAITSEPSPASQTICPGQSAQYCVSASGTAPLSYQWQKDGSDIPGATSDCYIASAAGIYRCVVSNACGSATSDGATLTVNTPPVISSQPSPSVKSIVAGMTWQYCVSASGTAPLSYQWQKEGSDIPGATSDCYIASVAGIYRCVVSNACGAATSDGATLTVNTSPVISSQPSPSVKSIVAGMTWQYCVSASGVAPLSYQWQKEGSDIPGATSDCYIASAAGIYRCVVSNAYGADTSSGATLVVVTGPPQSPEGVLATDNAFAEKVRVTWNSMAGVDGYEIWRSSSSIIEEAVKIATNTGSTSTTYDDMLILPRVEYWYCAKAFNAAGTSGFSSVDSGYRGYVHSAMGTGSVVEWGGIVTADLSSGFTKVAGGSSHSVGRKQDGTIVAWGRNNYGQCTVPRSDPGDPNSAPITDCVDVAAGYYHNLGLRADGSIVMWGYNNYGQCSVPEPNGFVAIAAGSYHSLGLKADGSIVAWGYNNYGQCNVPRSDPCDPNSSPMKGFVAIAAGSSHSLGLKADGSIAAWGYNNYGQCNVPEPNSGFAAIAAGSSHSLGLKSDGSIVAWGYNNYGQCNVPAPNTGFTAIAASGSHSLGLKADGSVVAWGYNNYGQCSVPSPNTGFMTIATGSSHSLGIKQNGSVVAWGNDFYGQSGYIASSCVEVAAGQSHRLGLREDGSILTWGSNNYGQCSVPNAVDYRDVVTVAAGYQHNIGLKRDGSLVVWGDNKYGQCSVPAPNAGFVRVAAGNGHSIGLKADGSLLAWGNNGMRQCNVPAPNADFAAVAAGSYFNLGLKSNGSIVAWGQNMYGQCNVPKADANDPNSGSMSGFVAIAAGSDHSLGLKQDGSIVAWGNNSSGKCVVPSPNTGFVAIGAGPNHSMGLKADGSIVAWGNNSSDKCVVPSPNTGFVAIGAGQNHSMGLKADGSIVVWGTGAYGLRSSPKSDPNYPESCFTAIAAGNNHCLAKRADGSITAWGDNRYNQAYIPDSNNSDFVTVAAGTYHSLGLKADGSVVCWGQNQSSQCNAPEIEPNNPCTWFVALSGGRVHSLGLKANGSVAAWGNNSYGQCTVPLPNSGFVTVAAGSDHSLGLKQDGSIVAWGRNNYGQCIVPKADPNEPNSPYIAIAAGSNHSVGLKANGSIVAWGDNRYGQCNLSAFGASPAALKAAPGIAAEERVRARAEGLSAGFVKITAGADFSVGLTTEGSLAACGNNSSGQCTLPAANTGFVAVSAGADYGLAIKRVQPADVDGNYRVDFADLARVADKWGVQGCSELDAWCGGADLKQDGTVNVGDIAVLAGHWLECSAASCP